MEHDYRLLALDLDGTLLGAEDSLNPRDVDAIARLQSRPDVDVTIVTGRLYGGTRDAAAAAGISGAIACADGAHILTLPTEDVLDVSTPSPATLLELRSLLAGHSALATFLMGHLDVICGPGGAPYAAYVEVWSEALRSVPDVFGHPWWVEPGKILKTLTIGSAEAIEEAAAQVRSELSDEVEAITFPITIMLEGPASALIVRKSGVDKGHALRQLCDHYGCEPHQTVVVGDWLNDIPMFEIAGRSFAMGQATNALTKHATDMLAATAANGGGGIAEAIARTWGSLPELKE